MGGWWPGQDLSGPRGNVVGYPPLGDKYQQSVSSSLLANHLLTLSFFLSARSVKDIYPVHLTFLFVSSFPRSTVTSALHKAIQFRFCLAATLTFPTRTRIAEQPFGLSAPLHHGGDPLVPPTNSLTLVSSAPVLQSLIPTQIVAVASNFTPGRRGCKPCRPLCPS